MRFEKHCWAEIDLDALAANFRRICSRAGGPVCAVVKADGYGHGALAVADALHAAGCAAFAVSCLAEARQLRDHGVNEPILILGYTEPDFADELAALDITQTLFSAEYGAALSAAAAAAGCTVACHLKADTGMGRIGFALRTDFEAAIREMETCFSLPGIRITGIFQHFAAADSTDRADVAYTADQYAQFARAVARLRADGFDPGRTHCANSAAQLTHPEWRCGLVRAGIILYGLAPSPQMSVSAQRPAITVCFFPRAPRALIRSRSSAACSKWRASASASISAVMSRISCLDFPSSSCTACSIRRLYSSAVISGRQNPSHRPMWKFKQGRSAPMSRGNLRLQVGSRRATHTASRAWRVSNRPPNGPKYRAESLAILFTREKRGYASLDRRTKGYPLSSFSRML